MGTITKKAGHHFSFLKTAGRHQNGAGRPALLKQPRQNTAQVCTFVCHASSVYFCMSCLKCVHLYVMPQVCTFVCHASSVYFCMPCLKCVLLYAMPQVCTFVCHASSVYFCMSCLKCVLLYDMPQVCTFV